MSPGRSSRLVPPVAASFVALLALAAPVPTPAADSPSDRKAAKHDTMAVIGQPENNLTFTVDHLAIATASLGPEWDVRTPAERAEFVDLMFELIERAYDRIQAKARGCRVEMTGEEMRPDGQIIRRFTARSPGAENDTMDFSLTFSGEERKWVLKDFSTDGVSLVKNYRSQFLKILKHEGFAVLIQKMRAKVERDRAAVQ